MEQIKQSVVVTFNEYDDGMHNPEFDYANPTYESITFENAIGYQLGSGFLGVQASDGTLTIYPESRIRQVVVTPTDKE